jgi:hypothetical protein
MVANQRNHALGIKIHFLIDEFGAELATDPPCQATATRMIGSEYDRELRGDFDVFRHRLDAAGRDVRDGAVTRQQTCTALDLRAPFAQLTFGSPPICKHCASLSCTTTGDPSA